MKKASLYRNMAWVPLSLGFYRGKLQFFWFCRWRLGKISIGTGQSHTYMSAGAGLSFQPKAGLINVTLAVGKRDDTISIFVNQKFILVLCLFSNAVLQRLFLRIVRLFFVIAFLSFCFLAKAQTDSNSFRQDSLVKSDSLQKSDSLTTDTSSLAPVVAKDTIHINLKFPFSSDSFLYRKRLFYTFTNPVRYTISEKTRENKDVTFYAVIALLLFFAFIRNSFSRYLSDLYSSYFRTTVRQRQVKEQLMQSPLPSLLFNVFFIVSTLFFLALHFSIFSSTIKLSFLVAYGLLFLAIVVIYGGKFLVLKFFGWVFQMTRCHGHLYFYCLFYQ